VKGLEPDVGPVNRNTRKGKKKVQFEEGQEEKKFQWNSVAQFLFQNWPIKLGPQRTVDGPERRGEGKQGGND